jgi:hypothetical protein
MDTEDAFWERRTTFWGDEEPAQAPAPSHEVGPSTSRRSRRIRALSRRNKLAALCAFVSSATLIVVGLSGLAGDASHDRGHAARASDAAHAGGDAHAPAPGPLEDALPLASVTDAPPAPAAVGAAPPPAGVSGSQASGAAGGGSGGAPAASTSAASAPLASAPAPAPAPASAPAPAPTPITSPTTTPPQPSCTIGVLGTCIVGGGGVLP